MADFPQLVQSRREWIEQILKPWCRQVTRQDLRSAELEWQDIAGRADPNATLWRWAWQRFPDLVHADLGIEETYPVRVTLRDGTVITGYPDSRQSQQGQLVMLCNARENELIGPYSIDEISAVERI